MRGLPAFLAVLAAALAATMPSPALGKGKDEGPPAFEREFLSRYASDDPKKRAEAVDGLVNATDPDRFRLLSTHVVPKEKRADVIAHAVDLLSRVKDPAVCEAVAKSAKTGNVDERIVWIESMAGMAHSGPAHQAALALLKDKETYVRSMSAYVLGEHRLMDALEPLLLCLDDRQWQVQAASLAAIPRLPDKDVLKTKLPKLVDFLEATSGRIRDDTADALRRITGKDLGREPGPWRKLIEGAADPSKPAGDGPPKPASVYDEKPHFYGMEVTTNRVVIIMDVSLSMNEPIEIDRDRLRRETSRKRAVTGEEGKGDKPKPGEAAAPEDTGYDIPWWRIKTRLDLARYQTINLLSKLTPEQSFDLILFSTKVNPWMGKLVPANQANKQKAISMVEAIKPESETNTWGAIAAAFELSDANVRGAGLGPDETFIVTDGAPSVGDIVDPQQILEATLQLWRVHQMRINVIQVGVDLSFLRKMAQTTGGKWKSFK
jgi:hypothetical protein